MTDIFLKRGETNPTDVKLTDSAALPPAGTSVTVALVGVGASTRGRVADGGVTAVPATPNVTVFLTGLEATSGIGTLTASGGATVAITGLGLTGAVGTLSVSGGANVALVGLEASGAVGTLTATGSGSGDVTVAITGLEATGAVGTLTVGGGANVSITGVEAVSGVGTLTVGQPQEIIIGGNGWVASRHRGLRFVVQDVTVALIGVEAHGAVGKMVAKGEVGLFDITDEELLLIIASVA